MICQQNNLLRLPQHIFLELALRFIGIGNAPLHINPLTADYGRIHIVALDRIVGNRANQREGTVAQGTAGGNDVHSGICELLQNID
ncbi:hypothetical protein D3C80_1972050 [compost metagenome]